MNRRTPGPKPRSSGTMKAEIAALAATEAVPRDDGSGTSPAEAGRGQATPAPQRSRTRAADQQRISGATTGGTQDQRTPRKTPAGERPARKRQVEAAESHGPEIAAYGSPATA